MNLHLTRQKKTHSPADPESGLHLIGRDPYMDWALILMVTIIAAFALITLGFFTFEAASARLSQDTLAPGAATVTFNEKALMSLLNTFDARATERTALLKAYDGPSDPSL